MIFFTPVNTKRLKVQLQELTMRQAQELLCAPPAAYHAELLAFLKRAILKADGEHSNPENWTVQETFMVLAHYLSATSQQGPNFQFADGNFLDYLIHAVDSGPSVVHVGQACGQQWSVSQLTNSQAAVMESMCENRFDWLACDMAVRLRALDEAAERPDATANPAAFGEWLTLEAAAFKTLAQSEFDELFGVYRSGLDALEHLFRLEFDDDGHVVMPVQGAGKSPGRFPLVSAFTDLALILFGRDDRPGGEA